MDTKKYIYDEDCNFIRVVLEGKDEEIKEQFGKNIYISDKVLFNPTIDEGDIREMRNSELINSGRIELLEGQYLEDEEIKYIVKPNKFYFWDSNKNEWVYDQEVEINSLEEELGSLELEIYNKQNELKELKENNKIFAAKKMEKEIIEFEKKYHGKLKRYNELAE